MSINKNKIGEFCYCWFLFIFLFSVSWFFLAELIGVVLLLFLGIDYPTPSAVISFCIVCLYWLPVLFKREDE